MLHGNWRRDRNRGRNRSRNRSRNWYWHGYRIRDRDRVRKNEYGRRCNRTRGRNSSRRRRFWGCMTPTPNVATSLFVTLRRPSFALRTGHETQSQSQY